MVTKDIRLEELRRDALNDAITRMTWLVAVPVVLYSGYSESRHFGLHYDWILIRGLVVPVAVFVSLFGKISAIRSWPFFRVCLVFFYLGSSILYLISCTGEEHSPYWQGIIQLLLGACILPLIWKQYLILFGLLNLAFFFQLYLGTGGRSYLPEGDLTFYLVDLVLCTTLFAFNHQVRTRLYRAKIDLEDEISARNRVIEEKASELAERKAEADRFRVRTELAEQISHDIRSPLAALLATEKDLKALPEDARLIVRSAVGRIRDIANQLIKKDEASPLTAHQSSQSNVASSHHLFTLIDSIVSEKRMQFRDRSGVRIETKFAPESVCFFIRVHPIEFERVLSNLINNAVEAIDGSGSVSLELSSEESRVRLNVVDTGKGISEDVLPKLGQRGQTFGKDGGFGLGLYHALTTIQGWDGNLNIESKTGVGTRIEISLPLSPTPSWFLSEIKVKHGQKIVILDDDDSIHQVWKSRFQAIGIETNLHHFTSIKHARSWLRSNFVESDGMLFLVDYEILSEKETGLDFVEEFGLSKQSVLVSSRLDNDTILTRCERQGIAVIPKVVAGFIPIIPV